MWTGACLAPGLQQTCSSLHWVLLRFFLLQECPHLPLLHPSKWQSWKGQRPRVEPRSCGPVRQRASLPRYPGLNELLGYHYVTVTPQNSALIIRLFTQNLPRLLQEPPNRSSSTFPFQYILHVQPEWSIFKKHMWLCHSPAVSSSVTLPVAPWAGLLSGPCSPLLPGLLALLGALCLTPPLGVSEWPASSGLAGFYTVSFF